MFRVLLEAQEKVEEEDLLLREEEVTAAAVTSGIQEIVNILGESLNEISHGVILTVDHRQPVATAHGPHQQETFETLETCHLVRLI